MKATYRRQLEARKTCLQRMLDRVVRLGPETESREHIDEFAYAKDYLISWIDRVQGELASGIENAKNVCRKMHSLPPRDNRLDNQAGSGADNA